MMLQAIVPLAIITYALGFLISKLFERIALTLKEQE